MPFEIPPGLIAPESALAVVFGMACLQSVGIPIPAILVLAPIGVMTAAGEVALWQVCIAYFTGQTTGDAAAYGLTLRFSPFINRAFPRLYAKVEHPIIRKLGSKGPILLILLAYGLSWFRPIVNYLAPVLNIPFGLFIGWSFLRNMICNSLYAVVLTGGVQLFVNMPSLRPYLISAVLILVLVLMTRRELARRRELREAEPATHP